MIELVEDAPLVISEPIMAEYRDHMGSDLAVVDAARASFGKESEWEDVSEHWEGRGARLRLKPADAKLIHYLATGYRTSEWDMLLEEIMDVAQRYSRDGAKLALSDILKTHKRRAQHWAPFAHCHLRLRMKLPVFLARQFVKHQIGATWSEESRRYVDASPTFWFPDRWHDRPADVKQGSGGELSEYLQTQANVASLENTQTSLATYHRLMQMGVCPEEARSQLTLNHMTTVVWTGSLLFWARVCTQRLDGHAQLAAQELAALIQDIVRPHFPVSWAALVD